MKPYEKIKCCRCDGKGIVARWAWDGPEPDECSDCGGAGTIVRYESGYYASWPGGPMLGRDTKAEMARTRT